MRFAMTQIDVARSLFEKLFGRTDPITPREAAIKALAAELATRRVYSTEALEPLVRRVVDRLERALDVCDDHQISPHVLLEAYRR